MIASHRHKQRTSWKTEGKELEIAREPRRDAGRLLEPLSAPRERTTVTWDPRVIGLDAVGDVDLESRCLALYRQDQSLHVWESSHPRSVTPFSFAQ